MRHWCCLFTRLVTKAAHIEVVNGLNTDAWMMAITRFMARRGKPHKIRGDNGINFVGTAREFRQCFNEWDRDNIGEQLALEQLFRRFKPTGALLFGRIRERLVSSCKQTMFAFHGNRRLRLSVLTTATCMVEQMLSARPLRPVSDVPEDLEELTPNHFLLGQPVIAEPLVPDSARYSDCRKMYKVCQACKQIIQNRWVKKYLNKWHVRSQRAKNDECILKVGDVLWLIDESVRRHKNNFPRVIDVLPSADGVTQSA